MNVKRTALIDGDIIAYRAAARAHAHQGDMSDVYDQIDNELDDWMFGAFCEEAVICFSCSREENFRRDHYPLYKSHRSGEPPAMLSDAKKILADLAPAVRIPRLEADDVMGILATNGKVENPVIVTIDKDLRQIPAWHFNPDKEDFPTQVGPFAADYLFYCQWLTGDPTDGYGGIKGVGPKKAARILNQGGLEGPDHHVLEAYAEAGYTPTEALGQARCARILRACDFDAETRKHIPWTPVRWSPPGRTDNGQ